MATNGHRQGCFGSISTKGRRFLGPGPHPIQVDGAIAVGDFIPHPFDLLPWDIVETRDEFGAQAFGQLPDLHDVKTNDFNNVFVLVERFSRKTLCFFEDFPAVFDDA